MALLKPTNQALVANQRDRVLSSIIKAWLDGQEIDHLLLEQKLRLDHQVYMATLQELHADGLIEQVT